jgi:hypothetical protein
LEKRRSGIGIGHRMDALPHSEEERHPIYLKYKSARPHYDRLCLLAVYEYTPRVLEEVVYFVSLRRKLFLALAFILQKNGTEKHT